MTDDASDIQRSERGNEVTVIRPRLKSVDDRNRRAEPTPAAESGSRASGSKPQSDVAGFGAWLRMLMRCETDEQCRSIQRGHVWTKRLGKWAMLFTVGLTLFVSDLIAAMIDQIQGYEAATTTFLYRWTAGWFLDVPKGGASLIAIWKLFDLVQFVFFFGLVVVAVRWSYADCRTSGARIVTFRRLTVASVFTNVAIYFGLRMLAHGAGLPI